MDISTFDRKNVGKLGECIAAAYLERHTFSVIERNWRCKAGEIDIVATKENVLHSIEVKTVVSHSFPVETMNSAGWDPAWNLHRQKIKRVSRATKWYCAERNWKGAVQIDGVLVWIRRNDGQSLIRYVPQLL